MSLTREETVDLLTVINGFDGRKVDELTVSAWLSQGEIGRWTYEHAVRAVQAHFTTSEAYLMPVHITTLVRQYRNAEAERRSAMAEQERIAALPAPEPARAERVRAIMDDVAKEMNWPTDEDGHYPGPADSPLAVRCPWEPCHAPAGTFCRLPRGRPLRQRRFHPGREDLWKEVLANREVDDEQ